jgi:arylsulfatase A-like enzyme
MKGSTDRWAKRFRSQLVIGSHQRPPDGPSSAASRLGPWGLCALAVWCGLASGLLEVATRVLLHHLDVQNRMYLMTRHFVWLAPLADSLVFCLIGLLAALVTWCWPRWGGWLSARAIYFLAVLPLLMVASSRIYPAAWLLLDLGAAAQLAHLTDRHPAKFRRLAIASFPALLIAVGLLATTVFGRDWLKQSRETGRPLPASSAPNVLLIVLDTVRADRLSLYGYERLTTPTLDRLARRGIRFDAARATAPWTLPSHGSMFTGRWPHELGTRWVSPLSDQFPTLAEYIGSRGYATAGFVGNTFLCSYETGLDRGFTHYEDYVIGPFGVFETAWLPDHALGLVSSVGSFVSRLLSPGSVRRRIESFLEPLFVIKAKKDAAQVNREFMRWLTSRSEPARPFFGFLNYFDAHVPYVPPAGAPYPFGLKPETQADFIFLIEQWPTIPDKTLLSRRYQQLARDSYDNCIAYLDSQLARLLDELTARGVLEHTLLVIVSDHGEGFGEHGLFDHGESVYRTEIGVPLLVVPSSPAPGPQVVARSVSVRDLPATIADLAGGSDTSPFPGKSLAPLWGEGRSPTAGSDDADAVISELPSPNPANPNRGRSPAARGPLVSLAADQFVYIRNQGDGAEELFDEREDPRELNNRALAPSMQPVLDRFRAGYNQLIQRSPTPVQ